jgi:hypothetical protein
VFGREDWGVLLGSRDVVRILDGNHLSGKFRATRQPAAELVLGSYYSCTAELEVGPLR